MEETNPAAAAAPAEAAAPTAEATPAPAEATPANAPAAAAAAPVAPASQDDDDDDEVFTEAVEPPDTPAPAAVADQQPAAPVDSAPAAEEVKKNEAAAAEKVTEQPQQPQQPSDESKEATAQPADVQPTAATPAPAEGEGKKAKKAKKAKGQPQELSQQPQEAEKKADAPQPQEQPQQGSAETKGNQPPASSTPAPAAAPAPRIPPTTVWEAAAQDDPFALLTFLRNVPDVTVLRSPSGDSLEKFITDNKSESCMSIWPYIVQKVEVLPEKMVQLETERAALLRQRQEEDAAFEAKRLAREAETQAAIQKLQEEMDRIYSAAKEALRQQQEERLKRQTEMDARMERLNAVKEIHAKLYQELCVKSKELRSLTIEEVVALFKIFRIDVEPQRIMGQMIDGQTLFTCTVEEIAGCLMINKLDARFRLKEYLEKLRHAQDMSFFYIPSDNDAPRPQSFEHWNVRHVLDWLGEVGLKSMQPFFEEHGITGCTLSKLTPNVIMSNAKPEMQLNYGLATRVVQRISAMMKETPMEVSLSAREVQSELRTVRAFAELMDKVELRNEAVMSQANIQIPPRFLCDITRGIMDDPVIADDGQVYERKAIETWFAVCNSANRPLTSPITRAYMTPNLVPNVQLLNDITAFIAAHTK